MAVPYIVVDFESASANDLKKSGAYRYWADATTEALCLSFETSSGLRGTWHPGLPCPPKIVQAIERGDVIFVAHNVGFERNAWAYMEREYGWPAVPLERWHCTQARALQLALPAKLEDVLKVMRLDHQKDMEGHRLTIGLSKLGRGKAAGTYPERTPEVLSRVYAYCEEDIAGEVGLHKRLGWLSDHERSCWLGSQEMNDRGIYLDMELVAAMQSIIDQAIPPLAAEFRTLTGLNVGQRDKILAWCSAQGVVLGNMRKETLAELLGDQEGEEDADPEEGDEGEAAEHVEIPDNVRRALSIRQLIGSASIKKLGAMRACVGYDGRARGLMVYHGTTPGRQTAKLLQPHNFPKGTLKEDGESPDPGPLVAAIKLRDPELLEMMYGPAVETIVSSLRHVICAAPGHVLLAGDYSGIQARTVLAVAGQDDKTALMAAGFDPYIDNACDIWPELPRPDWAAGKAVFGPQVKAFKGEHPKERGTGKNSVLGLGFQMAAETYQEKYAKDQPLEFAQRVVSVYREDWAPQVPELWYGLQHAARDTIETRRPHSFHGVEYRMRDEWMVATIPNGSEINYAFPHLAEEPPFWSPSRPYRQKETVRFRHANGVIFWKSILPANRGNPPYMGSEFWEISDQDYVSLRPAAWVQKQGRWIERNLFGGQLTENIVMKIEREIMEAAKKRLKANGFHLILEVHDELIAEALAADADLKAFVQIMEDVEPWVRDWKIPVAVDAWAGERYKK